MSNRQLVLIERLLGFGNKLNQAQPPAYVRGRSANSGSDAFDGVSVGLKFNEGGVSLDYASYCTSMLAECTFGPSDLPRRYLRSEQSNGDSVSGGS